MKKGIALPLLPLLALALCLLTGCGTREEATQASETELVYAPSWETTGLAEPGLNQALLTDDGFYAVCYGKIAEGEIPEGVVPQYEGEYDVYGNIIYYVNQSGSERLAYEPPEAPADPGDRKDFSASVMLERLLPGPDGTLIALESRTSSWYDGPDDVRQGDAAYWDHYRSSREYLIRRLDASGAELSCAALDWQSRDENDYLSLSRSASDAQGRVYVGGEQTIFVFDPDGQRLAEIETADWIDGFVRLRDGRVAACCWGSGVNVAAVDPERGALEEPMALHGYAECYYPGGGDYDLCYRAGVELFGFRIDGGESERLLSFLDCDVDAASVLDLRVEEDGTIRAMTQEREGDAAPQLVTLRLTEKASLPQKTELTLGALYPDMVSDAVLRFNRQHDDVRIRIVDYSAFTEEEDYTAALTRLTTQIMSGDMPDLLMLSGLPYERLAARGLLEDLYPYLDADAELKREDFLPTVLAAAEVDGKLCQTTSGFSLLSLMGASSVVGDTPGWTFQEMNEALARMPEGCTALNPNMARDDVLLMFLSVDLDSYVDWGSGTCSFENEEFYELLRFCAAFPETVDEDGTGESVVSRLASGKQMLLDVSISDFDALCFNDQYFGGDSIYIGYPTRSGVGNVVFLDAGCGMSSSCADKQAGWDFLRQFLTADYQRREYGLPSCRQVFDERLAEAMEVEYETDEEGRFLLDENGEKIPVSKGGMGFSDGSGDYVEFELYALTQEQADKLMEAIETASGSVQFDMSIYDIVREEAAAYFAGQKTVEEVAKLIQSKAGLYISEQS